MGQIALLPPHIPLETRPLNTSSERPFLVDPCPKAEQREPNTDCHLVSDPETHTWAQTLVQSSGFALVFQST
jgi:hypothetical protein